MKKTPIVFAMDYEKERVTPHVRPGQEWVLAGEGIATIKFDGQACLWQDGKLWKRFDRKLNKAAQRRLDQGQVLDPGQEDLFRTAPEGFVPCEPSPDPVTFHWPGWVRRSQGSTPRRKTFPLLAPMRRAAGCPSAIFRAN